MKNWILLFAWLLIATRVSASGIFTSKVTNGNWNVAETWNYTGSPALSTPGIYDDVIIGPGHTVTVTATTSCNSVSFTAAQSGAATGTLSINVSCVLTITTAINAPEYATVIKNDGTYTIAGTGEIDCNAINIGNPMTPGGSATSVISLVATVSILNVTGNLTLEGAVSGQKINNTTLDLQNGKITLGGGIITRDVNTPTGGNTYTITTTNGTQSANVIFTGSAPWSLAPASAVNAISLTGTNALIDYAYSGSQTVLATTYKNLKISGSGSKTTTGVAVNGTMSVTGGATVTVAPSYPIPPSMTYTGNTPVTTGAELPATVTTLSVDNTGGVTLDKAVTATTVTVGDGTGAAYFQTEDIIFPPRR